MEGVMIGFLAGVLFVGLISFYLSRMILRAKVIDMIGIETEKRIKNLEFDNSYLEKQLRIATKERNIAIQDAQQTMIERNEALLMLSKRL